MRPCARHQATTGSFMNAPSLSKSTRLSGNKEGLLGRSQHFQHKRPDQVRDRISQGSESQKSRAGGWTRKKDGKIVPKQGSKCRIRSKIIANPHLPEIGDLYEPYTLERVAAEGARTSGAAFGQAAVAARRRDDGPSGSWNWRSRRGRARQSARVSPCASFSGTDTATGRRNVDRTPAPDRREGARCARHFLSEHRRISPPFQWLASRGRVHRPTRHRGADRRRAPRRGTRKRDGPAAPSALREPAGSRSDGPSRGAPTVTPS